MIRAAIPTTASTMPIDADQTVQQLTASMGAMLMLHSSSQALIEASISPSTSSWYSRIDAELGAAEDLVVGWRQSGFLYFRAEILRQVVACGQAFLGAQAQIDSLFQQLESEFSAGVTEQIFSTLNALNAPVAQMTAALGSYLQRLASFQQAMEVPYAQMTTTVAQIQAEATDIQAEIATINAQIATLQDQVVTDRRAISRAETARRSGIVETVFGVLLAPLTGGTSLILAGIGVATIADAQEQVDQLESQISQSQSQIAQDHITLTSDQKQIATLQGLSMSAAIALSDIANTIDALGALRTTWCVLQASLQQAQVDVQKATKVSDAFVTHVWFSAACSAWQTIVTFADTLASADAPVTKHISVGN